MKKEIQNKTLVIPKEKATFWMDGRGRWHNQHGPFENKKIIDHFNAAIKMDASGYYVTQQINGVTEKVYFSCEDTALFAIDVIPGDQSALLLNTRVQIPLTPQNLLIVKDHLYIRSGGQRIKFSERALLKVADKIVFEKGCYFFKSKGRRRLIPWEEDGGTVIEGEDTI